MDIGDHRTHANTRGARRSLSLSLRANFCRVSAPTFFSYLYSVLYECFQEAHSNVKDTCVIEYSPDRIHIMTCTADGAPETYFLHASTNER